MTKRWGEVYALSLKSLKVLCNSIPCPLTTVAVVAGRRVGGGSRAVWSSMLRGGVGAAPVSVLCSRPTRLRARPPRSPAWPSSVYYKYLLPELENCKIIHQFYTHHLFIWDISVLKETFFSTLRNKTSSASRDSLPGFDAVRQTWKCRFYRLVWK